MDKLLTVASFESLAQGLIVWREDYKKPSYRTDRTSRIGRRFAEEAATARVEASTEPNGWLRRDFVHTRLILDRIYDVGSGLEAWLFDLWVLAGLPEVSLSHGLQVFVCQEGLEDYPIPEAEGSFPLQPLNEDPEHHFSWIARSRSGKDKAPPIVFQCFIPDSLPKYGSAPWRNLRGWKPSQVVGMRSKTGEKELLAQLLLLGIRQDVVGQEVLDALVAYLRPFATDAEEHIRDAVSHAVTHFLWPRSSLGRYVAKVARGFARGGAPSPKVQQAAIQYGVSPRTICRWLADGITDLAEPAAALRAKRARGKLARELANEEGITIETARRRITRHLARRQQSVQPLDSR